MSKVTEFARKNPEVWALLRGVLLYVLQGGNGETRQNLLNDIHGVDSDGDGVVDEEDSDPNNAAVTTRKPRTTTKKKK